MFVILKVFILAAILFKLICTSQKRNRPIITSHVHQVNYNVITWHSYGIVLLRFPLNNVCNLSCGLVNFIEQHNKLERPAGGIVVKTALTGLEVLGSSPGSVKSNTVSPTFRKRCCVSW